MTRLRSGRCDPALAQIIAIVDVYDAVTTKRAYQRSKSADDAIGSCGGKWTRAGDRTNSSKSSSR